MDKSELINKIMSDVKDEKVRDSLLKSLSENDIENNKTSKVFSELENLGINPSIASGYVKGQLKIGSIIGQMIGLLFTVIGAYFTILFISKGFGGNAFIPAIFCVAGVFSIYNSRKLSKIVK